MKMVVIGGTSLVGSKLVEKLQRDGHELLAAEALDGAQVVVEVSDEPPAGDTQKLLAAEADADVRHHVALSVVGGHSRAKLAHEEAVKTGPVPYTILRATQLFESIGRDTVRLPPVLVQPVAADDVASALADLAVSSPLNDTVELAGPEALRLDELVRRLLQASGDRRQVTTDPAAPYCGPHLPGDDARIANTRFEDWIGQSS